MSNAARALNASTVREMEERDRPISEQFRIVALQFADADAAASLMEELKTVNLEKLKTEMIADQGHMPDNRAERLVKSSATWEQYIKDMCGHRAKATKLKLQLEYLRIKHAEWSSSQANARAERRL